jgi:drug/metabolite transporter (DMT)-like permease
LRWTLSKKTRTQFEPIGWTAALAALAVTGSRGGNQVALKFGLTAFSPAGTAFGRMLVGMLTVGLWAWFRGVPLRPQRGEWRSLMQLSLLFVVQIGLLHIGADLTSPAYAVVLMNSNPVFANLMAHFVVAGDRLSPSRLLGLMLAFGAVAAVLLGRPNGVLASKPVLGNSIVLAAAVLVAVRTLYTQRLVQRIDATKTVFWQMVRQTSGKRAGRE